MKRLRNHTILLLFATAVTIFVAVVYAYMYNMINVSAARTATAMSIIRAGNDNTNKSNVLSSYKTDATKWSQLSGFFISPDHVVVFMESLESLGPKTGSEVNLASVDADDLDSAAPGTLGKFRAKVNATGSWSSVMRVLSLAEVMPYKILISNIKIDSYAVSPGSKSATNEWKLSFDIEAVMVATVSTSSVILK